MAKGRKGRARDTADITRRSLRFPTSLKSQNVRVSNFLNSSLDVEDLRQWSPVEPRRPRTISGLPARYRSQNDRRVSFSSPAFLPSAQQVFALSKKVMLCVRRKMRREVLLAKGRGGSGNRRPVFTWKSKERCT